MVCNHLLTLLALGCVSIEVQTSNVVQYLVETIRTESDAEDKIKLFGFESQEKLSSAGRHFVEQIRSSRFQTKNLKHLGTFHWDNCGIPSKESFVIGNLSVVPDPIFIPGKITVNLTTTFSKTVDAPLKVDVILQKNVFGIWLKVPCFDNIGSCTYPDLCDILNPINCPLSFVQQKVPCKCPFNKGNYTLVNADIDIPIYGDVPVGDYRATANLTVNGQFIACYNIAATIID